MHLTALAETYKHVVVRPFGIGTFERLVAERLLSETC
jgi:hypothetical protein